MSAPEGMPAVAPFTGRETREAWSVYSASYAGTVGADDSPAGWPEHTGAALALGAYDRAKGSPPRTRSALLAEVERLLTSAETVASAASAPIAAILQRVERWYGESPGWESDEDCADLPSLTAKILREIGGGS